VLACTTVPVLALRTASAPQRSALRVGIALDGSGFGVAAANYAIEHRDLFRPRAVFTLIHAVMLDMRLMPKHAKGLLSLPTTADVVQAETAAFEQALTPVAKQFAQAGLRWTNIAPWVRRPRKSRASRRPRVWTCSSWAHMDVARRPPPCWARSPGAWRRPAQRRC